MKRLVPLVIFLLLLLSGCGTAQHGADYDATWRLGLNAATCQEMNGGCYFSSVDTLYFIDSNTLTPVPLCSKPDCGHNRGSLDPDCDARFTFGSGQDSQFFCSDGSIYTAFSTLNTSGEVSLVKMDPDGQNRKTVTTFSKGFRPTGGLVHRGCYYAIASAFREDGVRTDGILQVDLSRGTQKVLYALEPGLSPSMLTAYGGNLYYNTYRTDTKDPIAGRGIWCLELASGTSRRIEASEEGWVSLYAAFADGMLFTAEHTLDAFNTEADPVKRIYRRNLDGSGPELIFEGNGVLGSDGERLYLSRGWGSIDADGTRGGPCIVIFSPDGEELDRVWLDGLPTGGFHMLSLFPGSGEQVLFACFDGSNNHLYRFPKAGIGSHAIRPEFVCSIDAT